MYAFPVMSDELLLARDVSCSPMFSSNYSGASSNGRPQRLACWLRSTRKRIILRTRLLNASTKKAFVLKALFIPGRYPGWLCGINTLRYTKHLSLFHQLRGCLILLLPPIVQTRWWLTCGQPARNRGSLARCLIPTIQKIACARLPLSRS